MDKENILDTLSQVKKLCAESPACEDCMFGDSFHCGFTDKPTFLQDFNPCDWDLDSIRKYVFDFK